MDKLAYKYVHIENMTPGFIQEIRDQGLDKGLWFVTLKMDGTNLQVAVDQEGNVTYGSRNQVLGRYDQFNNYQHVAARDNLSEKVLLLKTTAERTCLSGIMDKGPIAIVVFGELIGGYYRHKDVPPEKGAQKLQGRVCYTPRNEWVVFDVFYYQPATGDCSYLPVDVVNKLCEEVGLYHQIVKAKLPFDEAIAYPNDYEDTVGVELFGLPAIEHNVVEGNVLKPEKPCRFRNGDWVFIKNKNQIFLERGVKTNKVKNPPEPMTALDEEWYQIYMTYVTESRMMSVLSKMDTSNITGKDFGKLLNAFIEDADADFNAEYGGQIKVLESEHNVDEFNMHKVLKAAKSEASKMIRPHFLDFLRQNGVNC